MRLFVILLVGCWLGGVPAPARRSAPAQHTRALVEVTFALDCKTWRDQYNETTRDPETGLTALDRMHREVAAGLAEGLKSSFGFLDFSAQHDVQGQAAHRLHVALHAEEVPGLMRRSFFTVSLDSALGTEELEFRAPDEFRRAAAVGDFEREIVDVFRDRLAPAADRLIPTLFSKISIGNEVYVLRRGEDPDVCFLPFRYDECCASPGTRVVIESFDGVISGHHGLRGVKVSAGLVLAGEGGSYADNARGVESAKALLEEHGEENRPLSKLTNQTGVVAVEAIYVTSFIAGPCAHAPVPPGELEGIQ